MTPQEKAKDLYPLEVDKEFILKDYLVISENDEPAIWTKSMYEKYVSDALKFGACPAVRVVTHFNKKDELLSAPLDKEEK